MMRMPMGYRVFINLFCLNFETERVDGACKADRTGTRHHLNTLILDNKLHLAPIGNDVQKVLDIGTGTGI